MKRTNIYKATEQYYQEDARAQRLQKDLEAAIDLHSSLMEELCDAITNRNMAKRALEKAGISVEKTSKNTGNGKGHIRVL